MAEFLRLESTRLYGSNNSGCIWGLFHIFDSYQRRGNKRMLSNRRLGGRQCGTGTDILMANETGEDTVADKGANNIVGNKANNMNKSFGKTRILNFIGKKLLKRQKNKGKMSHSSRTIYVHLESNDYVAPGESSHTTSDSETSTIALGLDETDSSAMSEFESLLSNGPHGSVEGKQRPLGASNTTGYDIGCTLHKLDELGNHLLDEHIILKEKLLEARNALLKQKDSDPKGMTVEFSLLSKNFLEILHLFNTNREALYDVCNCQNSFLANDIQSLGCSAKAIPLNRSFSLTGFDNFIDQGSKHESVDLLTKTFGVVPDIKVVPGSHELRKQGETKTVLSRLRELKQRLKSVIVENRKERHRISMDRILDKIPSGQKRLEDDESDKLNLWVGHISRGGQGFKVNRVASGSSTGKFVHNGIQRSRSLTESLDRYSQLLDSISANEVRKAPERSNSIREGCGLPNGKVAKTHRRMPSNPEFLRSYTFSKDVQSEVYIASQTSKKTTSEPLGSDLAPTTDGSDKLSNDILIQTTVKETAFEQEGFLESNLETAFEQEGFLESNFVTNAVKANVPDEFVTPPVETSINETNGYERHLGSVNECHRIVPFQFSELMEEKKDQFNEQVSQIEDESIVKPEKTSPNSVLDPNIEEPVSPLKFTVMTGSDLQQLHENFEEQQLPSSKSQNDVELSEDNIAELSKLSHYKETSILNGVQAYYFLDHLDEKDTARYNYVKHLLSKSGFEALLCETEDSSNEIDAAIHILSAMPFEEQLIYDLLNEVLFKIYEFSTSPSSWLSRFHSKIRSMPTGSHLFEEVWAEIRWHFSSPQGLDAMVDKILARNFTKTDDWMNLYRDAECFGLLLEQLILDDLVDEVIVDFDELLSCEVIMPLRIL